MRWAAVFIGPAIQLLLIFLYFDMGRRHERRHPAYERKAVKKFGSPVGGVIHSVITPTGIDFDFEMRDPDMNPVNALMMTARVCADGAEKLLGEALPDYEPPPTGGYL